MSAADMMMPASSFDDGSDIESDLDLVRSAPEFVNVAKDVTVIFQQTVQTVVGPEVPPDYEVTARGRIQQRLKEIAVELSRIHYKDHDGDCYDKHFDVDFKVELTRTPNTH